MATTKIHPIRTTIYQSIKYITNPLKTENGKFVNGFMCSTNADETSLDFTEIQQSRVRKKGKDEPLGYMLYQSFAHDEITPEKAYSIAHQLAEKYLKNNYQYVITTHTDKNHIHNHIVFNSVSFQNGKTFQTNENRNKQMYPKLREISDKLCKENGLYTIKNPEKSKGKSWYEWSENKQGRSWKAKLKFKIDNIIMSCDNFEDFLKKCREQNIETVYDPSKVISLKFRMEGQERFARARTLGWYYEPEQIKRRIETSQLFRTGRSRWHKNTKIIHTANEKFQSQKGLERWADIQNMKEAARVINILTSYDIPDKQTLESKSITDYTHRMKVVSELNKLQMKIDELTDIIAVVKTYQQFKPLIDELKAIKSKSAQKKFVKEHSIAIEKFRTAKVSLKEIYANNKFPELESLVEQRKQLIDERKEKNEEYKQIVAELKELDFARTTIEDYIKNTQDVARRKSNELE